VADVARVWRCKEVAVSLPAGVVRGMFARAAKFSLSEGGRFDPRDEVVFLWSGPPSNRGARPIGSFTVRWSAPKPGQATIELIAWDRDVPDAVDELCRGVELLAGALVTS
jgi:hypothetical protein